MRLCGALLTTLALASSIVAQEQAPAAPKRVKFPELVKAIQAHRGRVVVVDFWANY
ncbi:MAG: hypothetical protein RMI91_07110 [Gemmatales bacterium]|nr:hypothetical protein [Gemmatales bacterium]MDW7994407.1 hypothetical protein [Gemmatales bacterium]